MSRRFLSTFGTLTALLTGSAVAPLAAQTAVRDTVDRIVGIVGNTPILLSTIDEQLFARYPNGQGMPRSPDSLRVLRQQILQELIDLELLYQQAIRDTAVKVSDEQVDAAVDEQLRNIRQRFPNDADFRADLRNTGFQTPDEYRRWLADNQRKELLRNAYLEKTRASGGMKPVVPTEREIQTAFAEFRGANRRPQTISFRQIVVAPMAPDSAWERARVLADSIALALRAGGDFAAAARRFSADPASNQQGGSLGWFRRGVLVREFEDVAFMLRPGTISNPVRTSYGYHVIQVERVQPAEVSARHVLITPEIRPEDIDSARARIARVREAIVAGAAFDSLQRVYHDAQEERDVRDYPADRIVEAYQAPLQNLQPGQVSDVFVLQAPNQPVAKYAIVELIERRDAGEWRLEDVKDRLRSQVGERLTLRRFLDRLRSATYVEVRDL